MSELIQLKVAGTSNPSSVGGAIVKNLEEGKSVELIAVGAGAVNQAVKGCAIAAGFAAPSGKFLTYKIAFADIPIDGEKKTAIKIKVLVD